MKGGFANLDGMLNKLPKLPGMPGKGKKGGSKKVVGGLGPDDKPEGEAAAEDETGEVKVDEGKSDEGKSDEGENGEGPVADNNTTLVEVTKDGDGFKAKIVEKPVTSEGGKRRKRKTAAKKSKKSKKGTRKARKGRK